MKVAVTGASGFVGSALVERLADDGHDVVASVRGFVAEPDPRVRYVEGADLCYPASLDTAVAGVEVVVHTAARVHRIREHARDSLNEYRRINVDGTLALAHRAAAAGARRFVFVSSIKVNGERTKPGCPFRADDLPAPKDAYGFSKLRAEQALFSLGRDLGLEIVVVRPPLIYGPGVKANFRTLMQVLARGIPLPLGAVDAKRSLIARDNLVDFLSLSLHHPKAPGRIFLVSDAEQLSVTNLVRRLGRALGQPARLIPVPTVLLELAARAVGKGEIALRLCSPLEVDAEPTSRLLGWKPPISTEEAFQRTADHFNANNAA